MERQIVVIEEEIGSCPHASCLRLSELVQPRRARGADHTCRQDCRGSVKKATLSLNARAEIPQQSLLSSIMHV